MYYLKSGVDVGSSLNDTLLTVAIQPNYPWAWKFANQKRENLKVW